jgi:hypothetical protein
MLRSYFGRHDASLDQSRQFPVGARVEREALDAILGATGSLWLTSKNQGPRSSYPGLRVYGKNKIKNKEPPISILRWKTEAWYTTEP